ncbi:hypothetical protein K3169_15950 [Pseudomonas phytophila]|uniref:Uncharacterized protein n=1 Tax=Pseudomonas phytophila TaxID=2867264 RepID=A0ABY6F7N3_9PSED|nr:MULTISPECIES: hypothetical protein [Pseudomonas]MCD5986290.1 hypothetical protein [Pseudomonas quasicaspiana]UXZ93880.1 hypothetical protein K3169_15950 [Pseudomonas phytophila]
MSDINTPYGILDSDHAIELLTPPASQLDQMVLAHFQRWRVVGIFLRCVSCGHSQKGSESMRPFLHGPQCSVGATEDFPWRELADLLQHLPR